MNYHVGYMKIWNDEMKMWLIYINILVIILCYVILINGDYRHKVTEDGTFKAWHFPFPGYSSYLEFESTVNLKKWTGTRFGSIKAEKDGKACPEVTAGLALIAMGAYDDHIIKQNHSGDWVLYKPGKTVKYFTWSAFYRIGSWKKVND